MTNLLEIGKNTWIGTVCLNTIIRKNIEKLKAKELELINLNKNNVRLTWIDGSVGFCFENENEFVPTLRNFISVCTVNDI